MREWIRDYQYHGLSLEVFLEDCHADGEPTPDEEIKRLWDEERAFSIVKKLVDGIVDAFKEQHGDDAWEALTDTQRHDIIMHFVKKTLEAIKDED